MFSSFAENMHFSEATLILTLMSVHTCFAEVRIFPDEPFKCTRYSDFVMKEYSCRPRGLFIIFAADDGVLTGEELLEGIKVRCSNQSAVETYINCMNELEAECPEQFPLVVDALAKKTDTFCGGTKVSLWLLTALQSGFSYSVECDAHSDELLDNCTIEAFARYSHVGSGITLYPALDILPQAILDLFQCTTTKFSEIPSSFEACGSSWQDMLLTIWLRLLASSSFGMFLADTDLLLIQEQLLALQLEENVK